MPTRTALITGASRGIGRACAEVLSQAGYRIALASRSLETLNEVAASLKAAGSEAHAFNLDLSSAESIRTAIPEAAKTFGRFDVLVNNAGVTRDNLAVRMKQADWESIVNTNLNGSFFVIQQVLPGMMRERWGRIINISSVVALSGNAGQVNYASAKAGLIGMTKSLALELGSRQITVNAVAPGFIETDMTSGLTEELRKRAVERTPAGRLGTPHDIAHAVRYLASDEASFVTGHVLSVNGGIYL